MDKIFWVIKYSTSEAIPYFLYTVYLNALCLNTYNFSGTLYIVFISTIMYNNNYVCMMTLKKLLKENVNINYYNSEKMITNLQYIQS